MKSRGYPMPEPDPHLLAGDNGPTMVVYRSAVADSTDEKLAVLRFPMCTIVKFGYPNDEDRQRQLVARTVVLDALEPQGNGNTGEDSSDLSRLSAARLFKTVAIASEGERIAPREDWA